MKAISKRQHRAIIAALQQLEELQQAGLPAGGFLKHTQSLNERFAHYEALLSQLAECIAEYEALYKEVKVNVVAPALRQARKIAKPDTKQYREVQQYVEIARAI